MISRRNLLLGTAAIGAAANFPKFPVPDNVVTFSSVSELGPIRLAILYADRRPIKKVNTLIIDESHFIKNGVRI